MQALPSRDRQAGARWLARLAPALLSLALAGCTFHTAAPLAEMAIDNTYELRGPVEQAPPVLVHEFEDPRPDGGVTVPIIPFWISVKNHRPERDGVCNVDGQLGSDLPRLLARELMEAGVREVVAEPDLRSSGEAGRFPVHVTGRIVEGSIFSGMLWIPGMWPGLVGVPFGGLSVALVVEYQVSYTPTGELLGSHEHEFRRSLAVGWYYNVPYTAIPRLFKVAMHDLLDGMVRDIGGDLGG